MIWAGRILRNTYPAVRRPSAVAGFTLVEMLVVLVILSLMAGLVGFGVSRAAREPDAAAVAARVRSILAQARGAAVAGSRRVSVSFDLDRRRIFRAGGQEALVLPDTIRVRLLVGLELVTADRQATLIFLPDGGSSGAEIYLSGSRGSASVRVPWLTGIPSLEVAE